MWRACQQNPGAVDHWIRSEFPKLKRRAKRLGAETFFGDEAGVRSDHHAGRTWARKGVTPVVPCTGARFGFNLIPAVSPRGVLRFMVVEGRINATTFIEFLGRLMHGSSSPVMLVADGHPSDRAKKVKELVAAQEEKLELHLLPGYSPERNLEEFVWTNSRPSGRAG